VPAFAGISLGCGNFGGIGSAPAFFGQGADEESAFAIMDAAWAAGIRWFDTADGYGGGSSERFVGRWRAARRPEGLTLTTKVFHSTSGDPADRGLAPDRIRRQLEGSLERLGVERIDLYLAHEPDPATRLADSVETFEQLHAEGLIGAWGLSNYDPDGIREALAVARPALVQNSFSLLDRGDEREVLPLCAEHGLGFTQFSPLAGGWLTGKYRRGEEAPPGSRMTMRPGPYAHLRDDRIFDALEGLERLAEREGTTSAALALAWLLADPRISAVVVGPRRPSQLEPALAALAAEVDREPIEFLFRPAET
jgi:aryl-alcohol dehydrogenase-like predicted oxidoreductase